MSLSGQTAVHEAVLSTRDFADRAAMDQAEASRLAVIVEELVTNLYEHGGLDERAVFTIDLCLTAEDLSIVLTDPGRSFDPSLDQFDLPVPETGGGTGLKLVRAWAIETGYKTKRGVNQFKVRLPRQASGT